MGIFSWGNKEKTAKKWEKLAENAEDPEKKRHYYQKALEIWSGLGDKVDSLEDKIRYYNRALEIDPEETHALLGKGYALGFLGNYEDAIRCHNAVLEKEPDNADALLGKGYALRKMRRYDEAIKHYDIAIDSNPDNIEALIEKGSALRRQKKYREAIEVCDRALDIDPGNGLLWYDKASTLLTLKRYKEAIECFNMARKFERRLPLKAQMRYATRKLQEEGEISQITEEKANKYLQAIEKLKARVNKAEQLFIVPDTVYEVLDKREGLDLEDMESVSRQLKEIKNANRSITQLIKSAKPDISIELDNADLEINKWQRCIMDIINNGDAHAASVDITFPEDVEVKSVTPVPVKGGERNSLEIAIKPLVAGDVPLEVISIAQDGKARAHEQRHEVWLKVSETAAGGEAVESVATEEQEGTVTDITIEREKKFYQGFIRFRISVTNISPYVVNDVTLDFIYDDMILRIDRHEPYYQMRGNKIFLGNITGNAPKTVVVYFDPLICTGSSEINCQVSYRDARGQPKAQFMDAIDLEDICPPVENELDINTGRLKEYIERLPYKNSYVYQLQTGFDIGVLGTIAREVVQKQDIENIRTFHTKESNILEMWYYGEDMKGHESVVIISISGHTESIELFEATKTKESLMEFLNEVGNELKDAIEERTAGKGGVQQIINVSIEDSVVTRPDIGFTAAGKEKKFCTSCGAEVPEGARFCIMCGKRLELL